MARGQGARRILGRTVVRRMDFLEIGFGHSERGVLSEEGAVQPAADQGGGQGDDQRVEQEPADIGFHVAGDGDRAGSRDHERVGRDQTDRERGDVGHHGSLRPDRQVLHKRGQHDKGGVEEYRDGHEIAGQIEGERRLLVAGRPQHGRGYLVGRVRLGEYLAEDDAQADEDSDALHRIAETRRNIVQRVGQRHVDGERRQDRGNQQSQERIHFDDQDRGQKHRDGGYENGL